MMAKLQKLREWADSQFGECAPKSDETLRRVSFRPSVDYASLFFDDCQHPAQNAYCDPKSIMAWRYVDTTHPKD